jgi:hypothetical protein
MRYGYCIFCDDIRTELGEKLSFMGVYNGVLLLPEFPYTLPKLCAQINLVTPTNLPYRSIVLECFAPGEDQPLLRENLDTVQLDEQEQMSVVAGEQTPDVVVGASLVFSPLRIRRPGFLSIRAVIDDEPVEISSLRIAKHHDH